MSFGILQLGELGGMSYRNRIVSWVIRALENLKLEFGKLGDMSCRILKLGDVSFRMSEVG